MKKTILIQLDPDEQPSVFDAVVAIDAGVDVLLRHGGVCAESARGLVHGAIFTRGPADLNRTAVFIGGSNVAAGEELLKAVKAAFFGPFRTSVLIDANGANTTAAAAVLAAMESFGGSAKGVRAAVLGGTGPVGQRVARLLVREGAIVDLGSRTLDRAEATAHAIAAATNIKPTPFATADAEMLARGLHGAELVVAAGAAGAVLLPKSVRQRLHALKVAIDLNAVPPLGIEGVEATDRAVVRDGVACWGALGVGGSKMKIHRRAIEELFRSNDQILDAEEVLTLGKEIKTPSRMA